MMQLTLLGDEESRPSGGRNTNNTPAVAPTSLTDDSPPGLSAQMAIIDEALELHRGVGVFALFSGGHDSLVAAHIASHHPKFMGVIHLITTTGLRETLQYVVDTCREQDWRLITRKPFLPFESYLVKFGFPGPPMHGFMYSRLKDRPLRVVLKEIRKELRADKRERIVLVSGVRKQESDRRAEIQDQPHTEGTRIWTPVIADYSSSDCTYYIRENKLKRSPVKDKIHLSGECFCGSFSRPGEYQEIDFWFPYQAERIRRWQRLVQIARENQLWELEQGLRDPDDVIKPQFCRWGPKSGVPQEQALLPMCHFCRGAVLNGNGQVENDAGRMSAEPLGVSIAVPGSSLP